MIDGYTITSFKVPANLCLGILSVFFNMLITKSVDAQRACDFVNYSKGGMTEHVNAKMHDEATLYIPVVFHIVYDSENQNLSDAQIYSQLQVINEDFNKRNSDTTNTINEFKSLAADVKIQFYLAEMDGVKGITRTFTNHGPFANDDLHRSGQGGRDAWDTKKYLNVWVGELAPAIFGYAASPGTEEFKDGVAVHYQYFGRHGNAIAPYNLGRTLTHEIGHWLGLQHPWGLGGCDTDDGLTDTPPQEGPATCVLNTFSCGSLSMVQNFMNTAEDNCMNLFTHQQKELMRHTLRTQRTGAYTDQEIITEITSPITNVNKVSITIYPNPITEQPFAAMNLQQDGFMPVHISITDLYGKGIHHYNIDKFSEKILLDFQGLSNGVYIAKVSNTFMAYSTKIFLNIN